MKRWLIGSIALLSTLPALAAQQPPAGAERGPASGTEQQEPRPGEETERVDRRAKEMRENLGRAKQVSSHVRVQVRLKNGNRLRGVVKDGRLVERVNGLRFVDAEASDRGAGIRLWYSGGTRNYVFVPFSHLSEYKILQRLSQKELADIERAMKMEEARRAELARQEAKLRQQQSAAAKPAGETGPAAEAGKAGAGDKAGPQKTEETEAQKEQQELFKLLRDYPPQQGWNAEKRDEIKRRFAVIGARPSEFEQRFVDKFDQWLKACKLFGVEPNQGKQETEEPTPSVEQGKK